MLIYSGKVKSSHNAQVLQKQLEEGLSDNDAEKQFGTLKSDTL